MAEISAISKKSRPQQRPPLMVPIPAGGLYERLDLPRYEPPKAKQKPQKPVKEQAKQHPVGEAPLAGKSPERADTQTRETTAAATTQPPMRHIGSAEQAAGSGLRYGMDRVANPASMGLGRMGPQGAVTDARRAMVERRGGNVPGSETRGMTRLGDEQRTAQRSDVRAPNGGRSAQPDRMKPAAPVQPVDPALHKADALPAPMGQAPKRTAAQQPLQARPVNGGRSAELDAMKPAAPVQPVDPALPKADALPAPMRQASKRAAAQQPVAVQSLSELLDENQGLPLQTAMLGVCEDQLPRLFDLNDPAPGALLVIGDERQMQLSLLRTAIASVVLRNAPHGIQFIVLSHLPDAWQEWVEEQGFERFCQGVLGVEGEDARAWIQQMADWTEQRRLGNRTGPPLLVLMDTLNFIPKLDYDLRLSFELLVKEGPQAAIWPMGAISTALANSLSRHIGMFQTILFGYAEDTNFYVKMAGIKEAQARSFLEPGQFAVKVGVEESENWLKFWLPAFE